MGRPLRRHAPNTDYLVTTRCHQARLLLRPEPAVNQAVLEWLTRAQRAYPGVRLFGLCVMSNHLHLLVRDTRGELAAWASYLLGNLARSINAIRGRSGVVFARRYSAEPVLDPAALRERLVYVVTNPVQAGLCSQSRHWPGLVLWTRMGEPESREVSWVGRQAYRRARYRARQRGQAPPSPEAFRVRGRLVLHPLPPEIGSTSEAEACALAQAIAARERELEAERKRSGQPAMTPRQLRAQDWRAAPRHPKRSPRPPCHTTERSLRQSFVEGFREFVGAFREASARWRAGLRPVPFPPWSYPPGGALVRVHEPVLA
jgi:REP element-mobilizing transposase RayT